MRIVCTKFVYDIVSVCVKLFVSISSSFVSLLDYAFHSSSSSSSRCFGSSVVLMGGSDGKLRWSGLGWDLLGWC